MTLYALKEKMASLKKEIDVDVEYIRDKAADPDTPMEEIEKRTAHRDELVKRFNLLKEDHDRLEKEQRESVEKKEKTSGKDEIVSKKAAYYRAIASKKDVNKAYEGLGAIPANSADLGNGNYLLPKNVSSDIISEPVEDNPLRTICRVTNIKGYEEPRVGFTIEDTDIADVTDLQTANEIAMNGDTVTYGRHKAKVKATVKETVMLGTDTDLVNAVEKNLQGALAKREKHFAFLSAAACGTDTAHAHMSFYKTGAIKEVTGATMYKAIKAAYADLPDGYAANASVVMRKVDYFDMIDTLTNNSETLFSEKPKAILGIPVVFCDKAVTPIVGDFDFYGINYETDTVLDSDKDIDKGDYKYVLTAWGDQQIRLASAFRLAKVGE